MAERIVGPLVDVQRRDAHVRRDEALVGRKSQQELGDDHVAVHERLVIRADRRDGRPIIRLAVNGVADVRQQQPPADQRHRGRPRIPLHHRAAPYERDAGDAKKSTGAARLAPRNASMVIELTGISIPVQRPQVRLRSARHPDGLGFLDAAGINPQPAASGLIDVRQAAKNSREPFRRCSV